MNNPCVIPTNFMVPTTCNHRWILINGDSSSEIRGIPGRNQLSFSWRGETPKPEKEILGTYWIQEVVEHLRHIATFSK